MAQNFLNNTLFAHTVGLGVVTVKLTALWSLDILPNWLYRIDTTVYRLMYIDGY